jgi:hypothetical protein
MCERVCAVLRLWPSDVPLACCQLRVRHLRWSQAMIFTCCVQRRFMANRNCLGSVGLVPPAFIWVVSSLMRLNMSAESGASTYKCAALDKTLRSQRNDDTPVKPCSSSTSDLPKENVSPDRALFLPPVFKSDKYEALSVQLERIRLNEVCTVDLIKTLLNTVHKLTEDVALLRSDSVLLKSQINKLRDTFDQPQGS